MFKRQKFKGIKGASNHKRKFKAPVPLTHSPYQLRQEAATSRMSMASRPSAPWHGMALKERQANCKLSSLSSNWLEVIFACVLVFDHLIARVEIMKPEIRNPKKGTAERDSHGLNLFVNPGTPSTREHPSEAPAAPGKPSGREPIAGHRARAKRGMRTAETGLTQKTAPWFGC